MGSGAGSILHSRFHATDQSRVVSSQCGREGFKVFKNSLACACCLIAICVPLIGAAEQKCGTECEIRGNPPPPSLEDDGGHSDEYRFRHLSDAGAVTNPDGSRIRRFRYLLRNLHSTNVLDVEWTRVGLTFQSISPDCCVLVTRESCKKPDEDTSAIVRYGAAKTFSKQASAYRPLGAPPAEEAPHRLQSTISGTFTWLNERLPIEVTFVTAVTAQGAISYNLTQSGSKELFFEMNALTTFWTKQNILQKALASSTWSASDIGARRYRLRPSGQNTLTIQTTGTSALMEGSSDLSIFAPDAKTLLIRATVSVWQPRLEQR